MHASATWHILEVRVNRPAVYRDFSIEALVPEERG